MLKGILGGLAAVLIMAVAVGIFISGIMLWLDGCDWLAARGHDVLAACLTPMAFILYGMTLTLFIGGFMCFREHHAQEKEPSDGKKA